MSITCDAAAHAHTAATTRLPYCPNCAADLNFIRATTAPPVVEGSLDDLQLTEGDVLTFAAKQMARTIREDQQRRAKRDAALDALDDLDRYPDEPSEEEDEIAVVPMRHEHFTIPSGKYKGLTLPRMVGVKPSYYAKVTALKEEIESDADFKRQAGTIAATYAALRREAEEKARDLADVKLRMTAAMLLMIDQFDVESEKGLTLKSGDKIRVDPTPHLVVTDKELFRQWCIKNELERSMTLPWGTANRLIKDMLVAGEPEPPGTEVFVRPKVVFTKGAK